MKGKYLIVKVRVQVASIDDGMPADILYHEAERFIQLLQKKPADLGAEVRSEVHEGNFHIEEAIVTEVEA